MHCHVRIKNIADIMPFVETTKKMWKHFSVELGHAVSPAVFTQVKS